MMLPTQTRLSLSMKMRAPLWLLPWMLFSATATGTLIINIDACDCYYYDTDIWKCTATPVPAETPVDECTECDGNGNIVDSPRGRAVPGEPCNQCDGNGAVEPRDPGSDPDPPETCKECDGNGGIVDSPLGKKVPGQCKVCDGSGGTQDILLSSSLSGPGSICPSDTATFSAQAASPANTLADCSIAWSSSDGSMYPTAGGSTSVLTAPGNSGSVTVTADLNGSTASGTIMVTGVGSVTASLTELCGDFVNGSQTATITAQPVPSGSSFASGCPQWSVSYSPGCSGCSFNGVTGSSTATVTPDISYKGTITVTATAGSSSDQVDIQAYRNEPACTPPAPPSGGTVGLPDKSVDETVTEFGICFNTVHHYVGTLHNAYGTDSYNANGAVTWAGCGADLVRSSTLGSQWSWSGSVTLYGVTFGLSYSGPTTLGQVFNEPAIDHVRHYGQVFDEVVTPEQAFFTGTDQWHQEDNSVPGCFGTPLSGTDSYSGVPAPFTGSSPFINSQRGETCDIDCCP
jgi:hypothetical protein